MSNCLTANEPLIDTDLLVLGGGPGGYAAAFRAADLGLSVVLVDKRDALGGVCLNAGCIPSKALLHCATGIETARELQRAGIEFSEPVVRLHKLRAWKDGLVSKLGAGLASLAQRRHVQVLHGEGCFTSSTTLQVSGHAVVRFKHAVVAVGSRSVSLPFLPEDPRIMDSESALEIADIPGRMLVVGGGIIGLELATVYTALGTNVTVAELSDGLIPGCDRDLVSVLQKRIAKRYEEIFLRTAITNVRAEPEGLHVTFEGPEGSVVQHVYDRILVAAGREPDASAAKLQAAGVSVDDRGFIAVDAQQRTNVPHIFAVGDVVGNPMLAHKASYEGKVAAEVAAGKGAGNDAKVIPAVAYTDPEIAWVGLTETVAQRDGIPYEKASFPWSASGRAMALGRTEGLTKILVDPQTQALLGVGIVGPHAGELISEAALAIEMGAEPGDVAMTIHPHPTLSETFAFSAEAYEGTLTELYLNKAPR